jgi:F0F1-type ATP synthase assembly protein I
MFAKEMQEINIKILTLFAPFGWLIGKFAEQTPLFSNVSFFASAFCGTCAGVYYIKKTFFTNNKNQNNKND